jgi:hypothetical protein
MIKNSQFSANVFKKPQNLSKCLTLRRAFERNRGYQEEVFVIHVARWDKFFSQNIIFNFSLL